MQDHQRNQPLPNHVWIDWGFLLMTVKFNILKSNVIHVDDKFFHMLDSPRL